MKTLLTAHSGCDGTPDNSLEFLAYAMGLMVDCLEVDVRRGAGGELVLTHDAGEGAARLSDALGLLRTDARKKLNCDLKEAGLELLVFRLAQKMGVADRIAFSGTVSARAGRVFPGLFARVDWYMNVELLFPDCAGFAEALERMPLPEIAGRIASALERTGARCLNSHYSIAETPLYAELRRRGVPLSVWTPGDEALIRRFRADGAYNVTTRNARRAVEIFAEQVPD